MIVKKKQFQILTLLVSLFLINFKYLLFYIINYFLIIFTFIYELLFFNNFNFLFEVDNFQNIIFFNLNYYILELSLLFNNLFNIDSILTDFKFNFFNQPLFFFFALLYFLSTILAFFFFYYLGLYGIFLILFIPIFFFWIMSLLYLKFFFIENNIFYINFGKWLSFSNNILIKFDFYFDIISFSFLFLTLTIAVSVIFFSFSYFRFEPLIDRLIIYLNYFVCSMIFLVSTNNLITFFLGWELIGLTSFVLINFWCTKISTLKASFKAFSFNKFSDGFLLLAIILVFNITLETDINVINSIISNYNTIFFYFLFFKMNYLDLLSFFFFFSASIKSAQLGAHIWLPDSMEAPVPASALIHSATLVSAGIFLVLRLSVLFDNSSFFLISIGLLGSVTAFYGGFTAMNQFDTKKILAYSTISHCGFLMILSISNIFEYTIIYLYIHGFFKAAIFMCVGNINRLNKNNQDIRKMGNFFKLLPFELIFISIGLFNLGGLPFSLGFYMKHVLLISLKTYSIFFFIIFLNCFFAALTGLYYSFRLIFYIFFDFKKNKNFLYNSINSFNLNSKFKSNSNFGAFFAIFFLFLISYLIGIFILNIFLSKNKYFSENSSFLEVSSIFIFLLNSFNIFFFFSFFNWIILINFFWLIFSEFRLSIKKIFFIQYFFLFFLLFNINLLNF